MSENRNKVNPGFMDYEAGVLFGSYAEDVRNKLLKIRKIIFETAEEHDEIGEIRETVKWEVPSYLTVNPGSGLTIRLDPCSSIREKVGIYCHCRSSFIEQCRMNFGDFFEYDGKRGILLNVNEKLPEQELRKLVYMALTYHSMKKKFKRL